LYFLPGRAGWTSHSDLSRCQFGLATPHSVLRRFLYVAVMAINVEKRKHDDDHSGNDSPVAKKVRIKLSPEVEKQFEALKKRMKKLKKAWLKKPDNDDAKAAYRASQKAVFEFTKTLSSGGPKPTEASESDADAPLKSLEAAYREARRKWKKDRKNDELFQAMKKAKAALDEHVPTSSASNADESAKPPASTSFEDAQAERAARALRLAEQRRRESELGVNQPPPTRGPVATASAFVPSSQSKVSPPQSQRASTTNSAAPSASFLTDDELQANLAAAKKAWKKDRSNDELFQAMQAAKAAIVEAEAARAQAKVAPRVPVQENQPAVAAPTSDTASTPISQAEVDELAAKAAAAKKQWKKDRSNDDLFAEMQATKKAHQEAQERFEKQKTHITAAPSPASQVEVPVNPLASSKSLEELRKDMQDARKAWKIDRSDSDLRAKYERAKEVFEFNEANPGAKAALTVAAAIRGPTQHTRGQTASLEELEAAMKEARRVWKIDRDNKELRAAYDAAKTALEHRRANPVGQTMGEAARATLLAQGGGRGCTIQLANLSFQITEEEIRAACAEIGDPLSITYCENAEGKFNGCALLTFESSDLASTAIKQLRGTLLGERKLKAFLASGSGSLPATDRITRKHNNPAVFVKPSQPAENPTQCVRCFVGNLKFNVRRHLIRVVNTKSLC